MNDVTVLTNLVDQKMIDQIGKVKHIPEILLRGRGFNVSIIIMQACKKEDTCNKTSS